MKRPNTVAVLLGAAVFVLVLVGVSLGLGLYDVSATAKPSALEEGFASFVVDRSVARRAPKGPNPVRVTPDVLARGLAEYREHCLVCHGAPGVRPTGIAKGLNPPAPDLSQPDAQEGTDGELFQVISAGIRMSGMPAFSPSESAETLWTLVAFIRHLPKLSEEERAALAGPPRVRPAESAPAH